MISFQGERWFAIEQAKTYEYLSSAAFLVESLPDSEIVSLSPDLAVWKLKPHFSFIKSTLETTLTIQSRTLETQVEIQLVSKGIGASSTVLVSLLLETVEGRTKVNWKGEITALTGLLKMVPKGLIQSSAQKVIDETWGSIEKRIQSLHPENGSINH